MLVIKTMQHMTNLKRLGVADLEPSGDPFPRPTQVNICGSDLPLSLSYQTHLQQGTGDQHVIDLLLRAHNESRRNRNQGGMLSRVLLISSSTPKPPSTYVLPNAPQQPVCITLQTCPSGGVGFLLHVVSQGVDVGLTTLMKYPD